MPRILFHAKTLLTFELDGFQSSTKDISAMLVHIFQHAECLLHEDILLSLTDEELNAILSEPQHHCR